MQRTWIGLGALAGLGAVILAAVAAHAPPANPDPRAPDMLRSAVQMQGWHALALLACGLWAPRGGRLADAAGAAFTAGLILFCGAVDAPPLGGALLMLGWLLLAISALRAR